MPPAAAAADVLALLSCCAVVAALAVHVTRSQYQLKYQPEWQQEQAAASASSPKPQPAPREHVALGSLPSERIPYQLRVDAFVAPARLTAFAHAALFRDCTHVFAVLDAIHAYALRFFAEAAWLRAPADVNAHITVLRASGGGGSSASDDDGEGDDDDSGTADRGRVRSHWRLPACVDLADATEFLLFPGVNPLTFAPDKVINLSSPHVEANSNSNTSRNSPSKSPSRRRYSYSSASFSANEADDEHVSPPKKQIVVLPGAVVLGGTFDVSDGSVYIGKNVRVEPNVYIKGPAIIGDGSTLRSGTYIRGDVITGQGVVLRGELKNAVLLDYAELCHPGYCGDSICGYRSHFGNQVTTANLNLFSSSSSGNLTIDVDGKRYDTGRKKIGVILGDHSQLGCSAVTDPCTLLLPNTVAYPLSRLSKGIYGPNQIIKNKPMECGVLEIAPLRLTSD